jgi:orotidine-5'-phosphate decarboxylase
MPDNYSDRLHRSIREKSTPALVGLDPRFDLLPEPIVATARARGGAAKEVQAAAFEEFCRRVIDVVAPLVPAVKPQSAFFEQCGPPGVLALQRLIRHARNTGLIVVLDAKRGDIGSTAAAYAQAYLAGEDPDAAPFAADALTVNPYLGVDTLRPFLELAVERRAGLYVLVRTSNPGAGDFQDRRTSGETLYESVARTVESLNVECRAKSAYGPVGAVVGATYPEELAALRTLMPTAPLLIPGYGSQGGASADVAGAFDEQGYGALVNSSRGINFACRREPYASRYAPEEWEQAVEAATQDMIADLREHTRAGLLVHDQR